MGCNPVQQLDTKTQQYKALNLHAHIVNTPAQGIHYNHSTFKNSLNAGQLYRTIYTRRSSQVHQVALITGERQLLLSSDPGLLTMAARISHLADATLRERNTYSARLPFQPSYVTLKKREKLLTKSTSSSTSRPTWIPEETLSIVHFQVQTTNVASNALA